MKLKRAALYIFGIAGVLAFHLVLSALMALFAYAVVSRFVPLVSH